MDINSLTSRKIEAFGCLKDGWRFGEGVVFSKEALSSAKFLDEYAKRNNLGTTDVFPLTSGIILFCIYKRGTTHEFRINAVGAVDYSVERNDN